MKRSSDSSGDSERMMKAIAFALLFCAVTAMGQSGRKSVSGRRTVAVPVIAFRTDDPNKPRPLLSGAVQQGEEGDSAIPKSALELFDGGVQQKIEAFMPDPTPARIVILLDNSATLLTDVKKLAGAPAAFAPEIYEGDKVMVIGYDNKPEVITDFTDDPKQLQNTLGLLRKTDTPRLFDALNVVVEDVLRPEVGFSKRVVVIVSDGVDRDSKIKFDEILAKLQNENITVYALKVKDRTRGALRRDSPKAADVLDKLTTGTGGNLYPIDAEIKQSVKEICDELRKNRYELTYYPEGINPINKRLLLISSSYPTITLRYKGWHPPQPQ